MEIQEKNTGKRLSKRKCRVEARKKLEIEKKSPPNQMS